MMEGIDDDAHGCLVLITTINKRNVMVIRKTMGVVMNALSIGCIRYMFCAII